MSTRAQNEKKFGQWDELPGGGRRLSARRAGQAGLAGALLQGRGRRRNDGAFLAGDLRRHGQAGRDAREIPSG